MHFVYKLLYLLVTKHALYFVARTAYIKEIINQFLESVKLITDNSMQLLLCCIVIVDYSVYNYEKVCKRISCMSASR